MGLISKETSNRIAAILNGELKYGYVLDIIVALKEDAEEKGKY